MTETERPSFSGRLGFVLATSASVIGLGNIWRFPYSASHYGGGIFVLIYIVLALTFGLCLIMLETAFGRKTGKSSITAFSGFAKKYRFIGVLEAIIPMLIVPYYCVIGGWVMKWFFETCIGNLSMLAQDDGAYWWNFITGATDTGLNGPALWFILFAFISVICIIAGVERGIEKLSRALVPVLLVMIVGIFVYELFAVDGIWDGIAFYLSPDVDALGPATFFGAVSQMFFSLGIGMGILITYGSYSTKDVDLEKSNSMVCVIDSVVALLAGFMVVPVAFIFGFGDNSGMGLMFEALPQVFAQMPGGEIVAPIFYLLIIFAAVTSTVSFCEAIASNFQDTAKMDRPRATAITAVVILVLGSLTVLGFSNGPLAFDTPLSQGVGWLGFFDTLANSILVPIVAILLCLFFGYVVKTTYLEEEIETSSDFRLKPFFRPMIKYVCPILITIILVMGILNLAGIRIWI